MLKISRRAFNLNLLPSLLTFSLVHSLSKNGLIAGSVKPAAEKWLIAMEQVSRAMMKGEVQPVEWQQSIETLLVRVEMRDLLRAIDYDRLASNAALPDDHESAEHIDFSRQKGLPEELTFAPYFYALKRGRAIVPHGHHNMTSMHMMLKGKAHAWHYERVADEAQHMIIRPTIDKVFSLGDVSTVSDQKNNIHWFMALTEPVFMFNIGVFGVKADVPSSGRDYLDPRGGEKLGDGSIRARKLKVEEAYKLYGKT